MKTFYIALQICGILLLLVFGVRMFGVFSTFITTDRVWLTFLFGGLLVCMGGFWLEEYQYVPVNAFQVDNRRKKMAACRNAICLCAVVLLFIVASYI